MSRRKKNRSLEQPVEPLAPAPAPAPAEVLEQMAVAEAFQPEASPMAVVPENVRKDADWRRRHPDKV